MVDIKVYVAGIRRNLDHLGKSLRSRSDGARLYEVFRLAPLGRVLPATIAPAVLLVLDPETVDFTPRPLPDLPRPPICDIASDIHPPNLW